MVHAARSLRCVATSALQRFRLEQGHVAHQRHHHSAGAAIEFRASHHQRVAGAQLLLLLNEFQPRARKGLPHFFRLVADDHVNPFGPGRLGRAQNVFTQQAARQRVQQLRMLGLEACGFARTQNQNRETLLPHGSLRNEDRLED